MPKQDQWIEDIKLTSDKYKQSFLEFAHSSLQQVINIKPNHIISNQLLSDVLVAQKNINQALEILENLYQVQPAAARSRLIRVLLIIAKNCEDEEEQLALYKRVFELDAEQLEAKSAWQKILQQRNNETSTSLETNFTNYELTKTPELENVTNWEHEEKKPLQPETQLAELSQYALNILENDNREATQALFAKMTELETAYEKVDPCLNLDITGADILNVIKTMHQYAIELIQSRQQEKKLTQLISIEREARSQHEQELNIFQQDKQNLEHTFDNQENVLLDIKEELEVHYQQNQELAQQLQAEKDARLYVEQQVVSLENELQELTQLVDIEQNILGDLDATHRQAIIHSVNDNKSFLSNIKEEVRHFRRRERN